MAAAARKYVLRPFLRLVKCFVVAAAAVSFLSNGFVLYDCIRGDGSLPEFGRLHSHARWLAYQPVRAEDVPVMGDTGRRWALMGPVLTILDDINPPVAEWVRSQQRRDRIVHVTVEGQPIGRGAGVLGHGAVLAKYDYLSRKLYISTGFFNEPLGRRAALLCHEYRHARQNIGKYFRYVVSHAFVSGGNQDIIESDAYLYEYEAERAMLGDPGEQGFVSREGQQ